MKMRFFVLENDVSNNPRQNVFCGRIYIWDIQEQEIQSL